MYSLEKSTRRDTTKIPIWSRSTFSGAIVQEKMNTNEEEPFLSPHPQFSPEEIIAFAQIKLQIAIANAETAKANAKIATANDAIYEGMTPDERLQFKRLGTLNILVLV